MENHHEETEPTNKWVATPIVMAFIFISVVIFFITLAARGKDKDKDIKTKEHGTEQHDATHEDEHGEVKINESETDTSKAASDTTVAAGLEEH